jgi:citrate synthase
MLHENVKKFMEGFRYDAHPMGMLVSTLAALSTFYPDAKNITDPESRKLQMYRLLGKTPTIAAYAYRHSLGLPYVYPDNCLSARRNGIMYRCRSVNCSVQCLVISQYNDIH